jgi:hypothetical protein
MKNKFKKLTKAEIIKATRRAGQYATPIDYHTIAKIQWDSEPEPVIEKDSFLKLEHANNWIQDRLSIAIRKSEAAFLVVPQTLSIDLCVVRHQHKLLGTKKEQRAEIISITYRASFEIEFTGLVILNDTKGLK